MFEKLNVFNIAYTMATHAGKRQALVSENIANADTPKYHAKDLLPFAEVYAHGKTQGDMIASRGNHMNASDGMNWAITTDDSSVDPNDNSVSIEEEILKGVEAKRQHDRALAIYRSSMNILRASLGRS
ncbi:FlgB family protein [Arenibacterium sp. LLYu02]|uniref:FlgB family protein n=1 Tax=Arenibacterium sp. LLYu02 TaxID=3404132 RepID=UPI003B2147BA